MALDQVKQEYNAHLATFLAFAGFDEGSGHVNCPMDRPTQSGISASSHMNGWGENSAPTDASTAASQKTAKLWLGF